MTELIADECIHDDVVATLREHGFVVHAISELAKQSADPDILRLAYELGLPVVTVDLGFGELIHRDRQPSHGVLLVRMPGAHRSDIAARLLEVLQAGSEDLVDQFIVVTAKSVRRRPLPPTQ